MSGRAKPVRDEDTFRRFDKFDSRVYDLESRAAKVEFRVEKLESRLDRVESQLEKLGEKVTGVDRRLATVEEKVTNHITGMKWAFGAVFSGMVIFGAFAWNFNTRLTGIDGKIESLLRATVASKIEPLLKSDASEVGAPTITIAAEGVRLARSQRLRLDDASVKAIASRALAVAATKEPKSTGAWELAQEVMSYQTTHYEPPVSVPAVKDVKEDTGESGQGSHPTHTNNWHIDAPTGEQPPLIVPIGKHVPIGAAARVTPIGVPPLVEGAPIGAEYLLLQGGSVVLDGYHLRRVILRGVSVVYRGGPLLLEQVYFIDCNFRLVKEDAATRLAEAVLQGPSVTLNQQIARAF